MVKQMTAHEIQQDEIYAEAYKAAENAFNKKYDKLLSASRRFIQIYEGAFGEPEECEQFFTLKKIIQNESNK